MKKISSLSLAMLIASNLAAQENVPLQQGSFSPEWSSLQNWECPEWFKDAKFGIWAHWGPQCQAEAGDWYARFMYYEGSGAYNWNCSHFGDPEVFGLKDLCNAWKADKWDPDALVKLYKSVGAKYFFALGQHHDNFDLWDSPYQEWNSVNVGPKKDLLKGWSDACKKYGIKLGVSMHGSHAWTWLEKSQDYDGNLTKEDGYKLNADGTEKWWKGLDPQELYAQNHSHSSGWMSSGTIHSQWDWGNGASIPSEAYKTKFQNRVLECVNDYNPDMLYFDDTVLPFYGCDEQVGLNILSHYYNHSAMTNGKPEVVVMGKQLSTAQKQSLLWDVERGIPDRVQEKYWQTCTCLGDWHYSQSVYNNNGYKSAQQVVDMLVDIVSKNGNMLLSVPIKGNGTIDDKEMKVLEGIKAWMDVNGQSIYGTRPWKTFGEGPLADASNPLNAQGFNENNNYTSDDVRYVQKNDTVYATIMRNTSGAYTLEAVGVLSPHYSGKVKTVTLLGYGDLTFTNSVDGVTVNLPEIQSLAPVLALTFDGDETSFNFEEIISNFEEKANEFEAKSGTNTGWYNRQKVKDFTTAVEAAKALANQDEAQQKAALVALNKAYTEIKENGRNEATAPTDNFQSDITKDELVEMSEFSRSDGTNKRFGTPANWTVENFNIPNGNDGTKNGIDRYPGFECLMLGVWNDAGNAVNSDLTNARIYRKLHLDAGMYYFGATYNTTYGLSSEAYIFVGNEVMTTDEIPEKAIAYYNINRCPEKSGMKGLFFTLKEEQDVVVGFQANLLNGSTTQEFRAESVQMLYYGEMSIDILDELSDKVDETLYYTKINGNTGFHSQQAVDALKEVLIKAESMPDDASYEDISKMYEELSAAYKTFQENRNPGGAPDEVSYTDLTTDALVETNNFSRKDPNSSTRFSTPANWTVENFTIPNGASGTKNGIDNYPGYNCLMLGIWNDRGSNTDGNLENARIYRKVHLSAGRYYFGAKFQTANSLNEEAYIYVADEVMSTTDVPQQSIAYYSFKNVGENSPLMGLFFNLEEEKDVVICFQADLSKGSNTQEFRASEINLRYYGEVNIDKLKEQVAEIEDVLKNCKVNNNTGYYSEKAAEMLNEAVQKAKSISESASFDEVDLARQALSDAYKDFLENGKNKADAPDMTGAKDITEEQLVEIDNFTRTNPEERVRFGTPLNWTVENFEIPQADNSGTKNGIDNYPGSNCLMLGIWNDRELSLADDMTNARIYRKVHLDAGRYYFGALTNTVYNLNKAYIFAAEQTLNTNEMEENSIAYYSFEVRTSTATSMKGIYFTLDEPKDVLLGFQTDLQNGPSTAEFRIAEVKLLQYAPTGIEEVNSNLVTEKNEKVEYYSINGMKLTKAPSKGLYIRKQGNERKVMLAQ